MSVSLNPHLNQPILHTGAALDACDGVVLMMHGRGHTPDSMRVLAERIQLPSLAYLAPAAADASWYPARFIEPIASNEPHLSYALDACDRHLAGLIASGIPSEKIVLLGFSQGACLIAEYALRHPMRYGGIIIFTGGLIGPLGTVWTAPGSFDGTPVFLGSSDMDTWVPLARVQESSAVFRRMGANVTERIYTGMEHLVNDDEIAAARDIMQAVCNGTVRQ